MTRLPRLNARLGTSATHYSRLEKRTRSSLVVLSIPLTLSLSPSLPPLSPLTLPSLSPSPARSTIPVMCRMPSAGRSFADLADTLQVRLDLGLFSPHLGPCLGPSLGPYLIADLADTLQVRRRPPFFTHTNPRYDARPVSPILHPPNITHTTPTPFHPYNFQPVSPIQRPAAHPHTRLGHAVHFRLRGGGRAAPDADTAARHPAPIPAAATDGGRGRGRARGRGRGTGSCRRLSPGELLDNR